MIAFSTCRLAARDGGWAHAFLTRRLGEQAARAEGQLELEEFIRMIQSDADRT